MELAATQDTTAIKTPSTGHIVGGKYRIDGLIGQGGMGVVYSATHLVSDKRVAIKWMLPAPGASADVSERFVREARATARIDHPNVVDIYDVGVEESSMFLVMERLHGESLAQRLDHGALPPTDAVALLMPALRAVAAAHAQGVIHRDLKPDNIFLCVGPDGEPREPKVLDFGISKIAAGGAERHDFSLTQSGTIMGTPLYMSPEQVRGLRDVDARGDVYAFGVILYEMLSGAFPFDAETYNELIVKIATEDPRPITSLLPDLDPGLVSVIERAMMRNRDQRYGSIAELAAALEPFAGGVTFRRVSSVSGNQWAYSQPVPRGTTARTRSDGRELPIELPIDPAMAATATPLPVRAATPTQTAGGASPTPTSVVVTASWSTRRTLLLPLVALCVLGALGMLAWLRASSGASGAGHRVEAQERTMAAPATGLEAPAAPARASVPVVLAAPRPQEPLPPPNAAAAPTPEPAAGPAAESRPARPIAPAARHTRAHRSEPASAPASAASTSRLPTDWDERLGRSPADAPATPSSPRHAGTLSVDDL